MSFVSGWKCGGLNQRTSSAALCSLSARVSLPPRWLHTSVFALWCFGLESDCDNTVLRAEKLNTTIVKVDPFTFIIIYIKLHKLFL